VFFYHIHCTDCSSKSIIIITITWSWGSLRGLGRSWEALGLLFEDLRAVFDCQFGHTGRLISDGSAPPATREVLEQSWAVLGALEALGMLFWRSLGGFGVPTWAHWVAYF